MMIEIKEIPEIINLDKQRRTVCNNSGIGEEYEQIKNIPTSGIVVKRINSWGMAVVHDPRDFDCSITNFDQLLPRINISKGVIEEDLVYGRKNTKSESWILLTADMVKESVKSLDSVKQLKPGYVYSISSHRNGDSPAVYLGRLGWKDEYGTLRPHHVFAWPEKDELGIILWLSGRDIQPLGYDDPDTYSRALEAYRQSWFGNKDLSLESISFIDSLKFIEFKEEMIFSGCDTFRYDGFDNSAYLIKQSGPKTVDMVYIHGFVRKNIRDNWDYTRHCYRQKEVMEKTASIDTISFNAEGKKIVCNHDYVWDKTYEKTLELVRNLVASGYKCIKLDDTTRKALYDYSYYNKVGNILVATLSDGTSVSVENLNRYYIKY